MSEPSVSIVIPTKNCEKTIGRLLQSVKRLDYKKFEVIVVDSSNDRTAEIVKKFKVRLFTIPYSKKRTANKQRNMGIKKAKGKIIAFTDGDCKVHRNWLKTLMKGFDSNGVGIVGGSIKAWGDSFFKRYHQLAFRTGIPKITEEKVLSKEDFFKKQLFTKYELPVAMNMAIRKDIFKKIGYLDESMDYLEENEFFWRMFDKTNIKMKTKPNAIVYHNHATGIGMNIKKYFKSGKGVGIFSKKYPKTNFAQHRLSLLFLFITSLIVFFMTLMWRPVYSVILIFAAMSITIPHSMKVAFKKKMPSAIIFPFFDILLCGVAYNLGILYGLVHGK